MNEPPAPIRTAEDHAVNAPLPSAARLGSGGSQHQSSPHSHKFLVVTIALAGLAIAAIAVAVTLALNGSTRKSSTPWSSWSPPDGGLAGERDIANAVSPLYRADPSTQLVVVTAKNVSATGSGTQIALRNPTTGSLSAISGTSAIYTLCGLGPNCAISAGTPSAARLLLLRREALELALYTFKYIHGIDNVIAILPPGKTEPTAKLTKKPPAAGSVTKTSTLDIAVVFQKQGLSHFLSSPLSSTLPEEPPPVAAMPSEPDAELVSVITGQGLFSQQLVQTQDGSSVIVLNPLPPQ